MAGAGARPRRAVRPRERGDGAASRSAAPLPLRPASAAAVPSDAGRVWFCSCRATVSRAASLFCLARRLADDGFDAVVPVRHGPGGTLEERARRLGRAIEGARTTTRARTVDVVAYGLGGLVARAWVRSRGAESGVVRLVTLGHAAPGNRGDALARPRRRACAARTALARLGDGRSGTPLGRMYRGLLRRRCARRPAGQRLLRGCLQRGAREASDTQPSSSRAAPTSSSARTSRPPTRPSRWCVAHERTARPWPPARSPFRRMAPWRLASTVSSSTRSPAGRAVWSVA